MGRLREDFEEPSDYGHLTIRFSINDSSIQASTVNTLKLYQIDRNVQLKTQSKVCIAESVKTWNFKAKPRVRGDAEDQNFGSESTNLNC